MKKGRVLITGASGEIGSSLVRHFAKDGRYGVVATDVTMPAAELLSQCDTFIRGSIVETEILKELETKYQFDKIFHLAGILSSGAERDPILAHTVNVQGTFAMLQLCRNQSIAAGRAIPFLFPSTIAVYGIPTLEEKTRTGKILEEQHLTPNIMYSHNKLYCESLGKYFTNYYRMLAPVPEQKIDFRCVRFPGVLSSDTLPTGGTTDYAPEMIHAAAQGKAYSCFVRPDTQLPFMTMPDALRALLELSDAPAAKLVKRVYNVGAFSLTAEQFAAETKKYFPKSEISYAPHAQRQSFVDMWPADVNDSAAAKEWGWKAEHDAHGAFERYMVPAVKARYGAVQVAA